MTSDQSSVPDPHPTKHCRACYSEMPKAANKCVKCGSVQDASRFLSFSSTILSLMVALVSVVTFAIPIIKRELSPPHPVPSVAIIESSGYGGVMGTLSNAGDAPMSVGVAQFVVSAPTSWHDPELRVPLSIEGGIAVIKPNDIVPTRYAVLKDADPQILKALRDVSLASPGTLNCEFRIAVVDATGDSNVIPMHPSKIYCRYAISVLLENWCSKTAADMCASQTAHP